MEKKVLFQRIKGLLALVLAFTMMFGTGMMVLADEAKIDFIKINRHSPYLSITLHKCYPYYLFGISTFPNSAYHSIALRKFSITIV